MLEIWSLFVSCSLYLEIVRTFSLVGPPAELAPFEKKTSVEGCGGGLQAAVFFPSSLWLEKRRPGGHRHGFWTIVWRIPYPILNQ